MNKDHLNCGKNLNFRLLKGIFLLSIVYYPIQITINHKNILNKILLYAKINNKNLNFKINLD